MHGDFVHAKNYTKSNYMQHWMGCKNKLLVFLSCLLIAVGREVEHWSRAYCSHSTKMFGRLDVGCTKRKKQWNNDKWVTYNHGNSTVGNCGSLASCMPINTALRENETK